MSKRTISWIATFFCDFIDSRVCDCRKWFRVNFSEMFRWILTSRLRVSWSLHVLNSTFVTRFCALCILHLQTTCRFRNMLIQLHLSKIELSASLWATWLTLLLISSIVRSTLIRSSYSEKLIKRFMSRSLMQLNFKKNKTLIFVSEQNFSNQSIELFVIKKIFEKKLRDVDKSK